MPERSAPKACPACGDKDLRRAFEPFHLGALLLASGLAVFAVGMTRGPSEAPRASPATPHATARVQAPRLVLPVEAGPARGKKITLRRGDVVAVRGREGATLLVEDSRGNRVRVASTHVQLQ